MESLDAIQQKVITYAQFGGAWGYLMDQLLEHGVPHLVAESFIKHVRDGELCVQNANLANRLFSDIRESIIKGDFTELEFVCGLREYPQMENI